MQTPSRPHPWRSLAIALLLVMTLLAGLLLMAPPAAAATYYVKGHITGNQFWLTPNTYVMTGNVTVDPTASLTIQPGVTVLGVYGAKLYVVGNLQAIGTVLSPIRFGANGTAPRWGGIQFNASAGSIAWSAISKADTAVAAITSSPSVSFTKVSQVGIGFRFGNSASLNLLNNSVDRATVGMDLFASSGLVRGNVVNGTNLGIQARSVGSLSFLDNVITNISAGTPGGASIGLLVDGLTTVTIGRNTVQRVKGMDGGITVTPGGRGANGTLAAGIFVNSTGAVMLTNNVVSQLLGGRGGDGSPGGLGNGGNGGTGGTAMGILVFSSQTVTMQGDVAGDIVGGRGGNGGSATSAGTGANGGNGGSGGGAVGIEVYNAPTSLVAVGESALTITGGPGGDGGAPFGAGHLYGSGGAGSDAYGIATAKAMSANVSQSSIRTIHGGKGGNSTSTLIPSTSTYGGAGGQGIGLAVLGADGPATHPTAVDANVLSDVSGGIAGIGVRGGGSGGNATGVLVMGDGTTFNVTTVSGNQVSSIAGGTGADSVDAGGDGGGAIGIIAYHVTPRYTSNFVSGIVGGRGGNASSLKPAGAGGQAGGLAAVQARSGDSSKDIVQTVAGGAAGIGKAPAPAYGVGFYFLGDLTDPTTMTVSNGTASGVSNYDLYIDNYTHVTTVNTTFGWSSIKVEVNGNLTVRNFLTVRVLWPNNVTELTGATIQVRDGDVLLWNVVSPGAPVPWLLVTDRVYYGAKGFHDNATNVAVTFTGAIFAADPRPVNMSASHTETFVMTDQTAPLSSANRLPAYETSSTFTVTYMASDPDRGTGLKNVTLWYKAPGKDWARFQTQTAWGPGQFSFVATADGPYAFVTIARDNASNVQPWPANNNTWTVVDTIPPAVLSTSPSATGANVSSVIVITFSEAMNTTSAQAAFAVTPVVNGTFSWSGGGTVLAFRPSAPLRAGTTYTVTIGTSAKDLAGNAMAQPSSFSFAVPAPPPAGLSLADIWPYFALVAVIAAGILLFFLLRRRQAASTETATEAPKPAPPTAARQEAAIDDVFLLYRKDGVLIKHETRRLRPDIDTDILSGMLTAVQQFVKDSFRGDEGEELNEMTVGQMHILIGRGKWLILAATITGGDVESMTTQIRTCIQDMEDHNWDRLEDWDGDMAVAKALAPYLKKLVLSQYAG